MRKLFVFISIVFFLTGCFNRKTLSPVIENPSAHMRSIFNLKDTASFRYTRLETTNASIFGNCNKILVNDSMVFVVDKEQTKAVYCFDLSGKFRGKINAQGRGPGEYLRLSDVQLKGDTIVILDVFSTKLIYYNLKGKYLRELIFKDHRSDPFVFLPDNRIVFYQGKSGKTKANDEVIIASVHGEISSGLYPRIDLTDKDRLFHSEYYFAQNQKGTFFIPVFDDRIYLLKNDDLIPVYDFSIKDKMMNRINIGYTELTQIKNTYSYFFDFFMNDYGTFLCSIGINNEPIDLCGNIDDTTLYTWGGHLPIKGVYKEYFLSLVNVSMIPGVEVSEGSDENAAVVFFDDPLKN